MNPSRLFILRPVATALLMAAILLVGLVAYLQLPVSALPEVNYPTIQVQTFYPGASADVMASTVTGPLEKQFGQIQGLSQMTSTSSGGASLVVLQFSLAVDIDVAAQEVQAAINAAQSFLPTDLPVPPVYAKTNPADAPVMTLALTSDTLSLATVQDLADTRLAPKISQLNGVGLVTTSGGQKPAIRIQANPTALSSYGLGLEDLRTSIANTSVNGAKGNFDGPQQAFTINANDQLTASDQYKDVIVTYRNGAPVRLADVATVTSGVENAQLAAWMNETPAVIMNIKRQSGANTIQVVDGVKALLPQLQSTLPAAVQVQVLTDLTTTIRASVEDVEFELALTIALVVLVIFLFLRSARATVIPSVAVPLSLVGTFAVMYACGYSLNNLTLMALTISTGFVVDDAIVMIENISRYLEEGMAPLEAALTGAAEIGFTIVSLTVSLIAVLIPLLFMSDITGRLFREFAITLAVTILVSAVVSLTLTPMMAARLLKHTPESQQGRFYRWSEHMFERTIAFYGRTLRMVLQIQPLVLLVAFSMLVLTVVLYIEIPKGFFPVQDTGVIQVITQAPEATSFSAMSARQQEAARRILQDPAVESLSSFIGIDGTNLTLNSGRMQVNLKPLDERRISAMDVVRRLQGALGEAGSPEGSLRGMQLYMQPVQDLTVEDRVSRTQFQYTLEDNDQAELDTWTTRLVDRLKSLPQLSDVATDQQPNGNAVAVTIDRVTASRFGISPQAIDDTLYDAFGQRQVTTLYTQTNQYHVILEAEPRFHTSPARLQDIYIQAALTPATATTANTTSTTHDAVPLAAFTHVQRTNAPLTITHQAQFPVVTISFNLAPGIALSQAVQAVEQATSDLHMPLGVQARFQGTAASFRNSFNNEGLLLIAALVTVYIVLGVLYESFIHPLTILSTLPSAGVGALLALRLVGQDLGIVGIIGIVLLIGIVKKNGIMMVDFALEAERRDKLSAQEAIYQASLLRFRPILMTTLAALFGGLPLALGSGIGSELRRPLGIAMVGGLLLSQAMTLYTTPVIYIWFDRLSHAFTRSRETP